MKFLSKCFLVFLLTLSVYFEVRADYITAADLSYKCQGNLKYEVDLTIYVECSSVIGNDFDSKSVEEVAILSEKLGTGTGSTNVTFEVFPIAGTGQEVDLFCKTEPTNCDGGTNRGVKRYTFRGNVDLANYGGASDDWKFFWQRDFRTDEIPTLLDAELESYYVEAAVNNKDFGCNNSPTFGSDAVVKSFINENNEIDLLVNDPDGDELRYKIISPRASENINLQYTNGASFTNPLGDGTNISISNDGKLSLNPKTADKLGLFDIEIEEYRGGKKIASVTRGIQINSFNSANAAPVITGFNGTDEVSTSYCVGSSIEAGDLVIKMYDPDKDQLNNNNVEIETSNRFIRPYRAGTNGDTTYYQFLFNNFPEYYVGTHEISVTINDDKCPTPKSTTKTFTFEIRENPTVSLPDDQFIPCVPESEIEATLTRGDASTISYIWGIYDSLRSTSFPYNYEYFVTEGGLNTSENKLTTAEPGTYAVRAVDPSGCASEYAYTTLKGTYTHIWNVQYYCLTQETDFVNLSRLEDSDLEPDDHSFTEYFWDVGHNNTTFTSAGPSYTYPQVGEYEVKFQFKTNYGCEFRDSTKINVCNPPTPEFEMLDSCTNSLIFKDATDYLSDPFSCTRGGIRWLVNGEYVLDERGEEVISSQINIFNYTDTLTAGAHEITMELGLAEGCKVLKTETFDITQMPIPQFMAEGKPQPDFYINCAQPDTVLRVAILDTAAGGLSFAWFKDTSSTALASIDTTLLVNEIGTYTIEVTDRNGCQNDSSITITYPISADFKYDTVCSLGNPMFFTDLSTSLTNKLISWEWKMGDGSTYSIQNPQHTYADSKDYEVILEVTDSVQCTDKDTIWVRNTFLNDVYSISPDYRVKTLCAKNVITGTSVTAVGDSSHIDFIQWNLGDGRVIEGDTVEFFYYTDDEFTITSETRYNSHPEVHANYCTISFQDKVEILPEFDGRIVDFRNCVSDSSSFYFIRETGDVTVPVKSYQWIVAENNSIDARDPFNPVIAPENIIFTSNENEVEYFLDEQKAIDIYLIATDSNNCESVIRADAQIKATSDVWASIVDTCFGLPTLIQIYSDNKKVSSDFGIMTTTGDTLLHSPLIRFEGDKLTQEPFEYLFDTTGLIPIKIFVEDKDLINNNQDIQYCRTVIDTSVYIDPVPHVDFEWDTVCAVDQFVTFKDLSTPPPGETIRNWYWDFGDTTSSTLQNPTHVFKKGGFYNVSLTVETDKCPATYTQKIYVKHKPTANFYFGVDFPEAFEPLPFLDSSTTVVGNYIDQQYYDFKDGTDSTIQGFEQVVEHTYNEIKIYFVDYAITNNEGCKDTITKRTDLNVYLELPNAFTPNNDGNNDDLSLIYKSIIELYDFKIYNRWGELVFDAEGNLDKIWDGSYKGKLQEAGVYVAHVRALGAYDTKFNFKQNITLLR